MAGTCLVRGIKYWEFYFINADIQSKIIVKVHSFILGFIANFISTTALFQPDIPLIIGGLGDFLFIANSDLKC